MSAAKSVLRIFLAAALVLGLVCSPVALAEDGAGEPDEKARAAALAAAMRSKDPGARAVAAEKAAGNQHPSLTSPLVRLLADKELGVRHMAMRALGRRELRAARKKAAGALTPKLKRLGNHPADRDELMRVIDTLRLLQQPSSIRPLLDGIDGDMELDEVKARLNAVAGVPDAEAIERLIQFLAKGRRGGLKPQRTAAAKALQWATGQRLGHDPDKWRAWWREYEKDFSFEALAEEREDAARKKKAKEDARKKRKRDREEKRKGKGKKKPDPGPSD